MKLLYAYFDYSVLVKKRDDFRGIDECSLNFSTTHNYSVNKVEEHAGNDTAVTYTLIETEKPKEEQIPEGFWGERIYNVTAIVGENGTGKSTLIHSLIKAVVKGLDPGVPFLLLLQKTGSKDQILYCGGSSGNERFVFQNVESCYEYPQELWKTKSMLIDNSLSVASQELDQSYSDVVYYYEGQSEKGCAPTPIFDSRKQLNNKSLIASVRFSNDISAAGRPIANWPVEERLGIHFRYETYQETRFLFDKLLQPKLKDFAKDGCPIPSPKYLYISAYDVQELNEFYRRNHPERAEPEVEADYLLLQKRSFSGTLLADALYSLSIVLSMESGTPLTDRKKAEGSEAETDEPESLFSEQDLAKEDPPERALAEKIRKRLRGKYRRGAQMSKWLSKASDRCDQFIEFVLSKKKTLEEVFQPYASGGGIGWEAADNLHLRRIDIKQTLSDEKKRKFVIQFLEQYRWTTYFTYYLSFSAGMSSGEKNMLRMLTQFRYALNDPSDSRERANAEKDTHIKLMNYDLLKKPSGAVRQEPEVCDTLYLFLDEADLTYHPEWQREFVAVLTTVLPRMFQDPYNEKDVEKTGCKDIQVILATHSPLMLGDFPKASTIYLKKEKLPQEDPSQPEVSNAGVTKVIDQGQQSTFGENLYTMLKDGFFMDDTIGEFARRKIDKIAKWCGETRKKLEKPKQSDADEKPHEGPSDAEKKASFMELQAHRQVVDLLPPGIIRNKLHAELDSCERLLGPAYERKALAERKERLRKELAAVEERLGSVGGDYASDT